MRRLFCCFLPRWGLTLAGLAAATLAIGAWQLGLDNNPTMGPGRILLLLWGIAALLLVHHRRVAILLRGGAQQPDPQLTTAFPDDQTRAKPRGNDIDRPRRQPWLALSLILPPIFLLYVWLVTAGGWTKPATETTFYYDMLADALASGRRFLNQTPDPRLAELPNPYDPEAIPRCKTGQSSDCYLMDASYFDGKYYLYWGPAPALMLAVLKIGGFGRLGDNAMALIAATALFLITALCLVDLWRRYFSELPRWLLAPPLILAGLAYPLPWVLDEPFIYEAAILLGAAFLTAGLAMAMPVLASGDQDPGRLALVGVLWSLSLGTRAVLGVPIVALVGAIAWRLLRLRSSGSRPKSLARPLAALALPLVATASLIAVYNFVRFSNPLEFGWRYQLGAPAGQSAGMQAAFDWGHLPRNAYNYLFTRFRSLGISHSSNLDSRHTPCLWAGSATHKFPIRVCSTASMSPAFSSPHPSWASGHISFGG